jgi:hypothetical protein
VAVWETLGPGGLPACILSREFNMRVLNANDFVSVGGGLPNGCTGVPNRPFGYDFKEICDRHDVNYEPGTNFTRGEADSRFLRDLLARCDDTYQNSALCIATAYVYYLGVRVAGGFFYEGGNIQ